MNNLDLFADDHEHLGQIVDRIDLIPTAELKAKWPKALAELCDVMACELTRLGIQDPDLISRKLAVVLAHYMGGRAYYLPTGENLLAALRDREIFEKWLGGVHIDALAKEYRISHPQIYRSIAEQRKLHRKRHQPDLFDS